MMKHALREVHSGQLDSSGHQEMPRCSQRPVLSMNDVPFGLMIHPRIHFIPLLHPHMAAMGCHGDCVLAGVAKPDCDQEHQGLWKSIRTNFP